MSNIKVTVTFEKTKTSRIDALLEEYEVAGNLVNETKRELAPIITEVGHAKHAAIMKQLEPIMDGMKKLSILKDKMCCDRKDVSIEVWYHHPGVDERKFRIEYDFKMDRFYIKYCMSSNHSYDIFNDATRDPYNLMYGADRGIVTHWNKLGIIDKLNNALETEIKRETENAISMKKNIELKLNNLIND